MPPTAQQFLKNILFLDIETVSCASSYDELDENFQALWDKKAAIIRQDPTQDSRKLFADRAAIYAEFGKVIVIGLGFVTFDEAGTPTLRTKALQGHDEKSLLLAFKELLENRFPQEHLRLCAHNGKEFDFPYLCRRMVVHGIPLPPVLDMAGKKPWEVKHMDTMELWKFGDRKSFTSLDLLARLLGIPSSKELMHGHEVGYYYYQEKALEKIAAYCVQDVVVTVQLLLKMNYLPLIPSDCIVMAGASSDT